MHAARCDWRVDFVDGVDVVDFVDLSTDVHQVHDVHKAVTRSSYIVTRTPTPAARARS
jgi:hypothetical protein